MSIKKPTAAEFFWQGDDVVHRPTNAHWWWSGPEVVGERAGHLGSVLPNGDDYDDDAVRGIAHQMLSERPWTT